MSHIGYIYIYIYTSDNSEFLAFLLVMNSFVALSDFLFPCTLPCPGIQISEIVFCFVQLSRSVIIVNTHVHELCTL